MAAAALQNPGGSFQWPGSTCTGGVREALHDVGMLHATLVRYHAQAEPPYPHELLRLEELDGSPLSNDQIASRWHQPPYALPLRLVRYAPHVR